MPVKLSKWGLIVYNALLEFYVDWDFIAKFINDSTYVVSIGVFKNLPKMFLRSYVTISSGITKEHEADNFVILAPEGIKSKSQVKKMLMKVEERQGESLSEKEKQEVYHDAEQIIDRTAEEELEVEESDGQNQFQPGRGIMQTF